MGFYFYDDKYPDEVARERLIMAIHGSLGELMNIIGEVDYVLTTIQPSDDCYHKRDGCEHSKDFRKSETSSG